MRVPALIALLVLGVVVAVVFDEAEAFFFGGGFEAVDFVFGAGVAGGGAEAEAGGGGAFGGEVRLVFCVGHGWGGWGEGGGGLGLGGLFAVFVVVEDVLEGELAFVGLGGGGEGEVAGAGAVRDVGGPCDGFAVCGREAVGEAEDVVHFHSAVLGVVGDVCAL